MVLEVAFQASPTVYALKRAHIWAINLRCAKVSQPNSFIFANLAALFCNWFKALTFQFYKTHKTSPLALGNP